MTPFCEKKIVAFFFASLSILALSFPRAVFAEPKDLVGIANHQFAGTEQYVAGLYAGDKGVLDYVAMAFKIQRSRMSSRSWSRSLIQQVVINTPEELIQQKASSLYDLLGAFKGPLKTGDMVLVEKQNDGQVVLSLNGIEFNRVDDPVIFDLLLQAWLGDIPPSTSFKDGLLTVGVDQSSRELFEYNELSETRVAEVLSWLPATSVGVDVDQNEEREESASGVVTIRTEKSAGLKMQPASVKEKVLRAQEMVEKPVPEKNATPAEVSSPIEKKPETETLTKPAESKQQVVLATQEETIKNNQSVEPAVLDVEKEQEEKARNLAIINYRSHLSRHPKKFMRYPQRSQMRREEGVVQLAVSINRSGEILSVKIDSSSNYPRLDRAAISAVKQAEPFQAFPSEISEERMEFLIPFAFKLR